MPEMTDRQKLMSSKRGLLGCPSARLETRTSYMKDYTPPPRNLYTGVGPKVGLMLKSEGGGAVGKDTLGLGEEGRSSYQRTFFEHGDAYKNRLGMADAARITHLNPRKDAVVDYTTSYEVFCKKHDIGDHSARPRTSAGGPPAPREHGYGLGEENKTMYTRTFFTPQSRPGYVETKVVSKVSMEGITTHVMQPYGPLCRSVTQDAYVAPPASVYQPLIERSKLESAKKKTTMDPVGTVKPSRDYGLGPWARSSYQREFYDKTGLGVVGEKLD